MLTTNRDVSELLVRHPDVDKITFTGSTVAGRKIASIAGGRMARFTMELGGKSPAVVLEDYDVEKAATTLADSYFPNINGQVCHSLTRIIVPRVKHDAMVEALAARAEKFVPGDTFSAEAGMGPLASARQRDIVEGYVAKAIAEVAALAAGGKRPSELNPGVLHRADRVRQGGQRLDHRARGNLRPGPQRHRRRQR